MKYILFVLISLKSIFQRNMNKCSNFADCMDNAISLINKPMYNNSENCLEKRKSSIKKLFNFTEFDPEHLKRMILLF